MAEVWYYVKVADAETSRRPLEGEVLTFLVSPKLNVFPESRTVGEVIGDAVDKKWECSYCSDRWGCPDQRREEIRRAVVRKVEERFSVRNHWDLAITIEARVTKY